ncbi:MAG: Crp/Fnr family transcriptional regulator, partial [Bacteroidia bacterium]|nr:Crp/Fnr family transcriptional regulator [Bacteroidia bacterium]
LPKGLFCVKSGKIKLSQLGTDGREQIVHLVHDGDAMGYRAILGNDVYSCTATAMEDSSVCFIPATDFMNLLETQPKLLLKISRLLAEKLRESEYKITQMAHQPVRDRLIHVIFSLIENYGFKEDNSTINLIIKREDLANLAGTTRETATRMLYELREQKIIALNGKYIRILNLKQLKSSYHSIL